MTGVVRTESGVVVSEEIHARHERLMSAFGRATGERPVFGVTSAALTREVAPAVGDTAGAAGLRRRPTVELRAVRP